MKLKNIMGNSNQPEILLWILTFVLLCLPATAWGDPVNEMITRANQLYHDGNFEQAGRLYEEILQQYYNGQILYNLGNCYFKQQDIPGAIIWYERAYRLLPRDHDIKTNLELCRTLLKDEIEEPLPGMFARISGYPLHALSLNEWSLLACVFYFLFSGSLICLVFYRGTPAGKFLIWNTVILGVLVLGTFSYLGAKYYQEHLTSYAVLGVEESQLRSGPGENFSAITRIHAGTKFEIRNRKNDWLQISLANGWNGWIPSGNVLPI